MIPLRDTQPSHHFPVVTVGLIAVNVLAFFYQISLDEFSLNHFVAEYGLVPRRLQLTDFVTNIFLHGGWWHLIGNMWFLWIYGDNIEDILGRGKFLLFYVLCGVAAGLVHVLFNLDSRVPTIGASGAIAGIMGAYLVKFPHSRILTLVPVIIFITTMEIPAWLILLYWFVLQFFSGVGTIGQSHLNQGGVAWFAHVGGFLAGIALIYLLRPQAKYRGRQDLRW
ncbi:MAG: rhomboid family intramembrane serine protease [Acidobacteriaceae bacterium]|jgi:membrane associated rhomboid family serine protease|nr:rhomboid family intramembrane serine protease [Acidobacteriaceae bacterium]